MATAISATTAAARTATGSASLVKNFETFLSILTAQLKNQDPLSPMEGNEFTQQLTQMSGVEQQLLSNQLLTSLVNQGTDTLSRAVNLIGKEITADRTTAEIKQGTADWSYELPQDAYMATLEVRNAAGQLVAKENAPDALLTKGRHSFGWNGTVTKDGVVQPDRATSGTYSLTVKAWAANGKPITVPVNMVGKVTAAEAIDGKAWVTVGGKRIAMESVTSVREVLPPAPPPPAAATTTAGGTTPPGTTSPTPTPPAPTPPAG